MGSLQSWADVASIATCIFVVVGYGRYLYDRCRRSKRLEEYLRNEKLKGGDRGQRSILHLVQRVGLTQDEIIQASFHNPRIGRRATTDEKSGLAGALLFEYEGPAGPN